MSYDAVEPSTGGQYLGKNQTLFHYLVFVHPKIWFLRLPCWQTSSFTKLYLILDDHHVCISVTPSTSGHYGGKSQTVTFYPVIGFQYTTFHKDNDPKVRVTQCGVFLRSEPTSAATAHARQAGQFHAISFVSVSDWEQHQSSAKAPTIKTQPDSFWTETIKEEMQRLNMDTNTQRMMEKATKAIRYFVLT